MDDRQLVTNVDTVARLLRLCEGSNVKSLRLGDLELEFFDTPAQLKPVNEVQYRQADPQPDSDFVTFGEMADEVDGFNV